MCLRQHAPELPASGLTNQALSLPRDESSITSLARRSCPSTRRRWCSRSRAASSVRDINAHQLPISDNVYPDQTLDAYRIERYPQSHCLDWSKLCSLVAGQRTSSQGTIEPNGSSTVRSTLVRVRDCKQCRRCVWRSCSTFTGSLLLLDNALLECPTRMPIVQDGFRRRVTLQLCMYQGAVSLFRDAPACPSKACNSRLRAIDRLYYLIPVSKRRILL